jgi:hypothetical protein
MMSTIADTTEPPPLPKPVAGKKGPYSEFFDSEDQARIRSELSLFFGPNADVFLNTYEKMRAGKDSQRIFPRTWCWPAFFGSFTWYFYRKMYLFGAALIFIPLIAGYLLGSAGTGAAIVFVIGAKGWYVNSGLSRIGKADKLGLTGAERADYLQRAGGVSWPAGIFAGLIYGSLIALAFYAAINKT